MGDSWTPEQHRVYGRAWYAANRARHNARIKAHREDNVVATRRVRFKSRLKQTYGLTLEEHEHMWWEQNGCCKICHVPEAEAPRGWLAIDHCHDTGRVRGLLCNNCNALLGMAKDRPEILDAAKAYLCQDG